MREEGGKGIFAKPFDRGFFVVGSAVFREGERQREKERKKERRERSWNRTILCSIAFKYNAGSRSNAVCSRGYRLNYYRIRATIRNERGITILPLSSVAAAWPALDDGVAECVSATSS